MRIFIPPHLGEDFPLYRLAKAGWLPVSDFDTVGLDDVRDHCLMLDAYEDAERRQNPGKP